MPRFVFIAALLFAFTSSSSEQQAASGFGWDRVESLPAGTLVHVNGEQGFKTCRISAVDEGSLACGPKHSFVRGGIHSVQIPHRGRSTLITSSIGAGFIGLIALLGKKECKTIGCEGLLLVLGGLTAILAPLSGILGDPTAETIYKRPKLAPAP